MLLGSGLLELFFRAKQVGLEDLEFLFVKFIFAGELTLQLEKGLVHSFDFTVFDFNFLLQVDNMLLKFLLFLGCFENAHDPFRLLLK